MADRIVMEVSRYRLEIESAPVFQAYEVPLTREWAILDGLNYIKDQLPLHRPQLRYSGHLLCGGRPRGAHNGFLPD
jgi:succinate dehydrogenase/fumarate reductase-like Fe-S protein